MQTSDRADHEGKRTEEDEAEAETTGEERKRKKKLETSAPGLHDAGCKRSFMELGRPRAGERRGLACPGRVGRASERQRYLARDDR